MDNGTMMCIAHDALETETHEQGLFGTKLLQLPGEGEFGLSPLGYVLQGPFDPFDHRHTIFLHRVTETSDLCLVLDDEHLFHDTLLPDGVLDG